MKKLILSLAFLCIVVGAIAQEMTVASYNIRNRNNGDAREGNGWEQRCPWICGLIEFHDFDIFGAQEVLDIQIKDMLALLPDYSYIGVGRDDGKAAGEHAPIFYKTERFQLLDKGDFWLSEVTDRPNKGWDAALPRICSWGHFADKRTGRKFWFFNLHMDHIGVQARANGAKLVMQKIQQMCAADETVMLTGDFNVDQNNEIYTTFTKPGALIDSYAAAEKRYVPNGTFNKFDPAIWTDSRIDHIFLSPSIRVYRFGVLTDTYRSKVKKNTDKVKTDTAPDEIVLLNYQARVPSDHFPIVAKIGFEK